MEHGMINNYFGKEEGKPSFKHPLFQDPGLRNLTTYKKVERQTKSKEYTKNHANRNHFVTWMMVEFHWKSG